MNNRWSFIFFGLACALLVALFVMFFEYYEEDIDLGWGSQAKRNPYLAAQMFHQQRGYSVTASDSIVKLGELSHYETLFIASGTQVISEKRLQQIIQWLNAGGHLIIATQSLSDNQDSRLFDYLKLQVQQTDFIAGSPPDPDTTANSGDDNRVAQQPGADLPKLGAEVNKPDANPAKADANNHKQKVAYLEAQVAKQALTTLLFDDIDAELKAYIDPSLSIDHPALSDPSWHSEQYQALYWAGSDYGIHFFQLEHGSGLVTLVASPKIFRSDDIILFDHSYLWQLLINQDELAILYGVTMPSLWSMLSTYMPELLIALAVLSIAWVWRQRQRFGPVINDVVTVRRSSAEHIAASAAYIWRGNWQQRLLQPVRDDIQQRAERRVSGYDRADPKQQLQLLATTAELDLPSVQHAMQSQEKLSEEHFFRSVRLLQRIRERL